MNEKLLWLATDRRHDCHRCCLHDTECNSRCEDEAKKMDVFFAYAIERIETPKEYYGG